MSGPADPAARLALLLRCLQLASPALPVGGFAYSQGLETAHADGLVEGEAGARRWIGDTLSLVLARFEAPLWVRAFAAWRDRQAAEFARIDGILRAARETAELRAESLQMGTSLARLLPLLGVEPAPSMPLSYPAAFAAACAGTGLDSETGLAAYLWSWAENQVLAALKTMPLGHAAGQRLLVALQPQIAAAVAVAHALGDEELGSAPLQLAICSARHEIQYARLFRS